jgi:hypothetical protein
MLLVHFRAISIGFESPENQFMPVVQVLSPQKKKYSFALQPVWLKKKRMATA